MKLPCREIIFLGKFQISPVDKWKSFFHNFLFMEFTFIFFFFLRSKRLVFVQSWKESIDLFCNFQLILTLCLILAFCNNNESNSKLAYVLWIKLTAFSSVCLLQATLLPTVDLSNPDTIDILGWIILFCDRQSCEL